MEIPKISMKKKVSILFLSCDKSRLWHLTLCNSNVIRSGWDPARKLYGAAKISRGKKGDSKAIFKINSTVWVMFVK